MKSMRQCQRRLFLVWAIAVFPLALLTLVLTFGPLEAAGGKVWSWLSAAVVPMFSLMTAVVFSAQKPKARDAQVDSFFYTVAMTLSIFYLTAVAVALLSGPVVWVTKDPWQALESATPFLTFVHGTVAAAIGVFFSAQKDNEKPS